MVGGGKGDFFIEEMSPWRLGQGWGQYGTWYVECEVVDGNTMVTSLR